MTCEPHGVDVRTAAAPSYFTMTDIPVDRPLTSSDLILIANDPNNNGNLSVLFYPDPDSCARGLYQIGATARRTTRSLVWPTA